MTGVQTCALPISILEDMADLADGKSEGLAGYEGRGNADVMEYLGGPADRVARRGRVARHIETEAGPEDN